MAMDGFGLGQWVHKQRMSTSLTPSKIKKLESLVGWSWDVQHDHKEERSSKLSLPLVVEKNLLKAKNSYSELSRLEGLQEEKDCDLFKKHSTAASNGNASSQYEIGMMYFNGEGVAQHNIRAYKWFSIARANGHGDVDRVRSILEKEMSVEQIEKAQEMSRNWKPTKK